MTVTVTDWIQAISTAILVFITTIYAWRTHVISEAAKQQADASVAMAREMRATRSGAVLPVIDIIPLSFLEQSDDELYARTRFERDDEPVSLAATLHNVGVGPALNVEFHDLLEPDSQETRLYLLGALAVGEKTKKFQLVVEIIERTDLEVVGRLQVRYQDVFGTKKMSSKRMTYSGELRSLKLGPLELS